MWKSEERLEQFRVVLDDVGGGVKLIARQGMSEQYMTDFRMMGIEEHRNFAGKLILERKRFWQVSLLEALSDIFWKTGKDEIGVMIFGSMHKVSQRNQSEWQITGKEIFAVLSERAMEETLKQAESIDCTGIIGDWI